MFTLKNMRIRALLILLLVVVAGSATGATIAMARGSSGEFHGIAVTGVNRLFGEPVSKYPFMPEGAFRDNFGFETMGALGTGANSTLLNQSTPDRTVVASYVDLDAVGLPLPIMESAGPELINVPLQDIGTWVLPPNLLTREDVPSHIGGPIVGATQAEPNKAITKGDWMNASGKLKVNCSSKRNSVRMQVSDLVPNRVYTVWALWLDPAGPTGPRFIPMPLGGAPNSYVTDDRGRATFKRDLNFCPTDAATEGVGGKRLAIIDTHLHSDHIAYGAVPAPIAAGFPPGTVLHAQLEWNLGAGEPANE